MTMTPSQACLSLIESSEGCRLTAYQDSVGVWTIGYGHTKGVHAGQTITQAVAETLLKADMQYAVDIVNAHAMPCTQGQFDALVDFVFNLGPGALLSSTLLREHNARNYNAAAAEFPKWDHAGGIVLQGLLKRRLAEQKLYEGN